MIKLQPFYLFALLSFNFLISNANSWINDNRDVLFDFGWEFINNDIPAASEIDFDAKNWQNINLPHDWSIEGKTDTLNPSGNDGGYFPTGIGWYRKTFDIPADFKEKKISIYFGGVYMNAEVFINGTSLGTHPYGYTSFGHDLTPYLNIGDSNTIAVRVDNSMQKNCRWYSGSGIYRHVWLQVTNPIYIDHWGVAITTPEVIKESAMVQIKTYVINDTDTPQSITLYTILKDGKNNNVGTDKKNIKLEADSTLEVSQTIKVLQPQVWSPDSPTLYKAQVSLQQESKQLDVIEETFGIRTISYSAKTGFLLNGNPVKLFGGCVHHDNGCLGAKAYDRAEERRVELLKAAGFNSVRTSHNPPSEAFLDACDRIGLLVIDEAFDGWRTEKLPMDYHLYFDEWSKKDVQSMVRRDRNHPSIVIWSIGNEIIERLSPGAIITARMLSDAIKEIDTTRPVTSAMASWNQGWEVFDPLMAEHDICGYNYMLHEAPTDHVRVPSRIILQTESYPKDAFYTWSMVNDNPYIIGDFVWTAMDYLGESGIGRTKYPEDPTGEHWQLDLYPWHGSYCGDIDLIGGRKPISHYRNLLWTSNEKLYMAVREPNPAHGKLKTTMWAVWPTWESWTWPGHEGKNIDIEIYSKYPTVRLYLNDKLIGEKATTRAEEFKTTFTLPYQQGELKAVGMSGNKEMETTILTTAEKAQTIKLTADRNVILANGQDLSFITIEIVDKNGILQPNAENRVDFRIEGPGEIIGIDNANTRDTGNYTGNTRKVWHGKALVVIKSTRKTGEITLYVNSENLLESNITIKSTKIMQ